MHGSLQKETHSPHPGQELANAPPPPPPPPHTHTHTHNTSSVARHTHTQSTHDSTHTHTITHTSHNEIAFLLLLVPYSFRCTFKPPLFQDVYDHPYIYSFSSHKTSSICNSTAPCSANNHYFISGMHHCRRSQSSLAAVPKSRASLTTSNPINPRVATHKAIIQRPLSVVQES